jgi:acetate kinase
MTRDDPKLDQRGTSLPTATRRVLAVNTGSSSLKASLFSADRSGEPARAARFEIDRIGEPGSNVPDHDAALGTLHSWLEGNGHLSELQAVGHRVVHGGRSYRQPAVITAQLLEALEELVSIDPEHLPQAIAAMRDLTDWLPHATHVACFDTSFHRTMPRIAQLYPLPRRYAERGLLRFGFHGLSCESIMYQLEHEIGGAVPGRLIIAHLGNGSSMTAVAGGRSVETTMGLSPTGGLMMGTRTGDIDPGALLHLMDSEKLTIAETSALLNERSGLLGLSGWSSDMRDLLERRTTDPAADEAVSLFCYTARKAIGSLAAVLGGLDQLVFTGGIGEHAAPVRAEICTGLQFIGVEIAPGRNERHETVISPDSGRVTVRVINTDEEAVIARHASRFVTREGDPHV